MLKHGSPVARRVGASEKRRKDSTQDTTASSGRLAGHVREDKNKCVLLQRDAAE